MEAKTRVHFLERPRLDQCNDLQSVSERSQIHGFQMKTFAFRAVVNHPGNRLVIAISSGHYLKRVQKNSGVSTASRANEAACCSGRLREWAITPFESFQRDVSCGLWSLCLRCWPVEGAGGWATSRLDFIAKRNVKWRHFKCKLQSLTLVKLHKQNRYT